MILHLECRTGDRRDDHSCELFIYVQGSLKHSGECMYAEVWRTFRLCQ